MKQRKPKQQPRPQSPGFDMAMAALVVILEDDAEDDAKRRKGTSAPDSTMRPLRRA